MGREYVQCVAAGNLSELSPTAFRILLRMAVSVRDDEDIENGEPEGMYYAGWKSLTVVLGRGVFNKGDPLPANVERQIARGIRELKAAGYVIEAPEWIQEQHMNRVYRLNMRDIPIV